MVVECPIVKSLFPVNLNTKGEIMAGKRVNMKPKTIEPITINGIPDNFPPSANAAVTMNAFQNII
jgi:hypothetical protein